MNPQLTEFIAKARHHNLSNDEIRQRLLEAGWAEHDISPALGGDNLDVPLPPHSSVGPSFGHNHDPSQPIGVVENLSPRGFEYSIMFITLWLTALAAVWILNAFIYGAETSVSTFPLTVLIVSVPMFLLMFFRLRGVEHKNPALLHDPSRRKSIQGTQRLAFVILLVQTIFTLYAAIQPHDYSNDFSLAKIIISWAISMAVFGGIFAYYWVNTQKDRTLGR